MSDTTGWGRTRQGGYEKMIGNYYFELRQRSIEEHAHFIAPHYESTEKVIRVEDLLKAVRWQEPQVGQLPFDRGYNLAMTQVQRALTGDGK